MAAFDWSKGLGKGLFLGGLIGVVIGILIVRKRIRGHGRTSVNQRMICLIKPGSRLGRRGGKWRNWPIVGRIYTKGKRKV